MLFISMGGHRSHLLEASGSAVNPREVLDLVFSYLDDGCVVTVMPDGAFKYLDMTFWDKKIN